MLYISGGGGGNYPERKSSEIIFQFQFLICLFNGNTIG